MNQRPLFGYRFAEIQFGDTLQRIAARELGDASQWYELIALNSLVPPFLTDDPTQAGPGVLLSGQLIRLPAPVPVVTITTDPNRVFGIDVQLNQGALVVSNGDLAVVSGRDNLRQALGNRINTDQGELLFHPSYGSRVRRLIGTVNGPTAGLLAAQYAKSAVEADARIKRVTKTQAAVAGDAISVSVEAEPVVGSVIDVLAST